MLARLLCNRCRLAVLGACLSVGACLPVHQTHYLPEAAGARYFRGDACDVAANTAHLSFHGVELDVGMWSAVQHGVHIRFAVPQGMVASLAGDRALLVTHGAGGETRVELSMSRLQYRRMAAPTEPMPGSTSLKRYLFGLRARTVYALYEFRAVPWDIDYGDTGTLTLPDLVLNGVRYDGPQIRYRRSRVFGWVWIGC